MSATTHRGAQPSALATEPVTIGGAVLGLGNAVLGALPLFGVEITAEQIGAANLVFVALVVLVTVLQRHYSRSKASVDAEFTPNDSVVEKIEDHIVIAGEGSELPTGTPIREAGSLDPNAEV